MKQTTVGTTNDAFRRSWLEKTLKKIPAGNRILDAGAGEQQYKKFCTHLNYVSQDFAQYDPSKLDSGLQMHAWDYGQLDIVSDIASIPEKDASFDAIMCVEVFEHIVNPREAIAEFSRLLRHDGTLIITAPFCSLTHFAPYHFYTGFSTFFYKQELEANGFEVIEMTPNGNYFEYLGQEIRRIAEVAISYCDSPGIKRLERFGIQQTLQMLQRFSDNDKGSSELLCHGYQVVAKKIIK